MTAIRSAIRGAIRNPIYDPLAGKWGQFGQGTPAAGLLGNEKEGFALSFQGEPSALVRRSGGHQFSGDPNDLLTYAMPSAKYVRNASGVLVSGATMRTDYAVDGTALGLLIENQQTNIVRWSEDFTQEVWFPSNATVTANARTGPDGAQSMALLTGTDNIGSAMLWQSVTLEVNASYTGQVYLAAGTSITSTVGVFDPLSGAFVVYVDIGMSDDELVIIGTDADSSMLFDLGGGLYRLDFTFTTPAELGSTTLQILPDYSATNGSVHVWGAQLKPGLIPGSYIKTEGAQVTRAADQISLTTSDFPFNGDEGTLIVEFSAVRLGEVGTQYMVAEIADPVDRQAGLMAAYVRGQSGMEVRSAGFTTEANFQDVYGPGTFRKMGLAYKADDFAACFDGSTVNTDESGAVSLTSATTMGLGMQTKGGDQLNGHIRSLVYIPRRISNAELQARTA